MKKLPFLALIVSFFFFQSCEAFFTSNWFQAAAVYDDISLDEALTSGDPDIMQELLDQLVEEAANATGEEAAELYLDAAELALGISGLSDPAVLFEAPELLSSGDGGVGDMFAVLTESNLDLDALEDVSVLIENAENSDPGAVPPDMWLFAAAGYGAAVVNEAEDNNQEVEDYLGDDPLADEDTNNAVQALVYAIDVLPDDTAQELWDDQEHLEDNGIVFPP